MTRKSLVAIALLMLMSLSTGCSMWTKEKGSKKNSPWESMKFWKKEYQTPTKMAVIWSHDLLTVAGQPPTRGCGGRIYFYNEKSQTIPVEGELVVHGFDESRKRLTGADQNVPDKRFRFTAEQFTEHFSESDLGASYSVWIPWDTNDNTLKELTLIPTFVSSTGQMIQGAPAKVVLPGHMPSQPNITVPVQTVAYEQSTIPTAEGKLPVLNLPVKDTDKLRAPADNDMRVTTIKLPSAINRGRQTPPSTTTADAPQINPGYAQPNGPMNGPMNGPVNPVAPYVNAQLEQMRAEAVANAFRPLESAVPSQAGAAAAMPASRAPVNPGWAQNRLTTVNQRPMGVQNDATSQGMPVGAGGQPPVGGGISQPINSPSAQNWNNPNQPYRGDDYPGGLPPGFQFSPQGTAW